MIQRVHSHVQSAADLVEQRVALCVPSYQRPYVWPSDDATKLLDDIDIAMRDGESHYYIGTILSCATLSEGDDDAAISYELIDGQQRMTTLMLLALAFLRILPENELACVPVLGKAPRLRFAIRERVQGLLGYWANLEGYQSPGDEAIVGDPYMTQVHATLVALEHSLKQMEKRKEPKLKELSWYLLHQVKWVNNVLPPSMDLNRVFATANTAGVQLEQSDMLKARLMKGISTKKVQYEAIWQACESMDNYFERNVRAVFPSARWAELSYDDLACYVPERFPVGDGKPEADVGMSIVQLAVGQNPHIFAKAPSTDDDADVYCTPIISFSLLLLHTYRIFRFSEEALRREDIAVRLNETRLSECFSTFIEVANEAMIKRFIECLWRVRYQFDRWVVKWVTRAEHDERQLRLTTVGFSNTNGGRLSRRSNETSNISQLESVRYFTGERSAQYWLTPFLGQLIEAPASSREEVEVLLERIDNLLSLTLGTQKEASFALLSGDAGELEPIRIKLDYLESSAGTGFEHYWFQKLEYVLWREQAQMTCFAPDKLNAYRIVSRNSIEHVHPQHERYDNKLERDVLDAFGNLVLLSPGENSSYSNKPVDVKRAEFFAKPRYDSLKLALMFGSAEDGWSAEHVANHQRTVIDLLERHYVR